MEFITQTFFGVGVASFISQVTYKFIEKCVTTVREKITVDSVSECLSVACSFMCRVCRRQSNPYENYLPNNLTVEIKDMLLQVGESLHRRTKKISNASERIGDSAYYAFPSADIKIQNLIENQIVEVLPKNRKIDFAGILSLLRETFFNVLLDENFIKPNMTNKLKSWITAGKIKIRQSEDMRTIQIYIGEYDKSKFIPLVLIEIIDKYNKLAIAEKSAIHRIASECRARRKKKCDDDSSNDVKHADKLSLGGTIDLREVVVDENKHDSLGLSGSAQSAQSAQSNTVERVNLDD